MTRTTAAIRIYQMNLEATIVFLMVSTCFSTPVDEPIRIDLQVYDQPQSNSDVFLAHPIQPENYPGGESVKANQVYETNLDNGKQNWAENTLKDKLNLHQNGGIFSAPVTVRESALLESEGFGSKLLSIKDNLHGGFAGIFQPKPIVDTISESEKYGNTGDKFYTAGRKIVGGAESFSNFVNTLLEFPGTIIKSITRGASEKLNNFGGKLVGL